ncbi:MAG: carbamoyltransferase [Candidatus Omnitrophota bacterium]|nr:MAG: carbamoyltransferase [Candidatus Omnitrophota bacterium]
MNILGIGPSMFHDPAAALIVDARVVAAAEEERFIREKHATNKLPLSAIRYCLDFAGIRASDIDFIAFPWSSAAYHRYKYKYFKRKFSGSPDRAIKAIIKSRRICRDKDNIVKEVCSKLGVNFARNKIMFVEHHLAHAASSYYFSGMKEAAILSMDGSGEFTATLLAKAEKGKIVPIKEICVPDSLGLFYSTLTEYLGFKSNNGEYKVMGMAPYGDPCKVNLDGVVTWDDKRGVYRCNDKYVWVNRRLRFRPDKMYSKLLVEEFGLPRAGDCLDEPYTHIAAATQKKLEDITVKLVDNYLKEELLEHGNLCFAGGCALNVALNRKLLELPYIKNLWVQPASHDAGASLGAAAYLAKQRGGKIEPMTHVYLGPQFNDAQVEKELKLSGFSYSRQDDICQAAADLLVNGEIVGWFQGRMEWGPRALGNRSILGNPAIRGTADRINAIIKFREKWRPFCPSILKEKAQEILSSPHPAPFMTIAFKVKAQWKDKIPEVVHVDGTLRPQVVDKDINSKFHSVIEKFYRKSGMPVVINTSLNRRGEPLVCSPADALNMFRESGLEFLAIGDFLIKKN